MVRLARRQRRKAMTITTPPERQTMTVEECARYLGIGRTTCYAAVRAGVIPSIRILGRVVISRAAIDRLLGGGGLPGPDEAVSGQRAATRRRR
jgi:excisionase family DNA binding protein